MNPSKISSVIRYHLGELGARNGHHEFEHLARHLARARVYSNVVPSTGPVGTGGDGGRDFETFATAIVSSRTAVPGFAHNASGLRKVAFACSLDQKIEAKIKSDVRKIAGSGPVDEIVFFCERNVPVAKRHKLEQWAKSTHEVALQIFDGNAIAELLNERDVFWIAQEYLHIPAETMPPAADEEDWYAALFARWLHRSPMPFSSADFTDIKFGLRRATFHADARPRLNFWIGLMEAFLAPPAPRALQRSALYEIAVAFLRGKGDLNAQLERVRDYYSDVESWGSLADLENAATLAAYAFGDWALGNFKFDPAELFAWRRRVADTLEREIDLAPGPGRKSGLLWVRGYLRVVPEAADSALPLDAGFHDWDKMLDEAEKTPLFPIDDFADHLSKITALWGKHPLFARLTARVDALVATRSGSAAAGEKTFDRAIAFYGQDLLLEAIGELHRTSLRLFTGDTMARFQQASYLLARCYLELGLAFAAKNIALAAAYIASYSDEPEVAHTLPKMLLLAADADDAAGNSLSYLQLLLVAIAYHLQHDPDPLQVDKYPEIQTNLGQVAALRGIAARSGDGHKEVVDEALRQWPEELRLPVMQASQDQGGFWLSGSWQDVWQTMEASFLGRPFGDLGASRQVEWRALGIRWITVFENTYAMTPLAEQLIAELQIVLAAFAGSDLALLPVDVRLTLSVATKARRPKLAESPVRGDSQEVALDVKLAGAASPPKPGEVSSSTIALLCAILGHCSVLANSEIVPRLKDRVILAAERVYTGRPYRELYCEFVPSELFHERQRQASEPLHAKQAFMTRQHDLLAPLQGTGPNYSAPVALESIGARYEKCGKSIAYTLPRLMQDPQMRRFLRQWHDEGLRDWEILAILANAAANLRHPLPDDQEPSVEHWERFRAAFDLVEGPGDSLEPQLFTEETLRHCRRAFQLSFLESWRLEAPPAAHVERALERFLIERYGLRSDDVEHNDMFHWQETAAPQSSEVA